MSEKVTFEEIFEKQLDFQRAVTEIDELPADNTIEFERAALMVVEELGEVLKEDKRWKNLRSDHFDFEAKKEEMADLFIVAMNLVIYSGVPYQDLFQIIHDKQSVNFQRLAKERG